MLEAAHLGGEEVRWQCEPPCAPHQAPPRGCSRVCESMRGSRHIRDGRWFEARSEMT